MNVAVIPLRLLTNKSLLICTALAAAFIVAVVNFVGGVDNRYKYAISVGRIKAILKDACGQYSITLPSPADEPKDSSSHDAWGTPIGVERIGDKLLVVSLGSDAAPGGTWHASDIRGEYIFGSETYTIDFNEDVRP